MKARPIKWVESAKELQPSILGHWMDCPPDEATHLTIKLPGPSGKKTLPVMIGGTRAGTNNWTWNGSIEAPTLKPSVLTASGHFDSNFKPGDPCWCKYNNEHPNEPPIFDCWRCHTWIADGKAEFLADSTHEHAGKTLELLDV